MTEKETDTEAGRTLREYQSASKRLGCLQSQLRRMTENASNLQKAMDGPLDELAEKARNSVDKLQGSSNVGKVMQEIAETAEQKHQLRTELRRQGFGDVLAD